MGSCCLAVFLSSIFSCFVRGACPQIPLRGRDLEIPTHSRRRFFFFAHQAYTVGSALPFLGVLSMLLPP